MKHGISEDPIVRIIQHIASKRGTLDATTIERCKALFTTKKVQSGGKSGTVPYWAIFYHQPDFLNDLFDIYSSEEEKLALEEEIIACRVGDNNFLSRALAILSEREFTALTTILKKRMREDAWSDLHIHCNDEVKSRLRKSMTIYGLPLETVLNPESVDSFYDIYSAFLQDEEPLESIFRQSNHPLAATFKPKYQELFSRLSECAPTAVAYKGLAYSLMQAHPDLLIEACNIPVLREQIMPNIDKLFTDALRIKNLPLVREFLRFPEINRKIKNFSDILSIVEKSEGSILAGASSDDVQRIIIPIVDAHIAVKQARGNAAEYSESSMSDREKAFASIGYEKALKLYDAQYQQQNGYHGIEPQIRNMILDVILADLDKHSAAYQFLSSNRAVLIKGNNKPLMDGARIFLNSKTDQNHLAWRAFDAFAPISGVRENALVSQYVKIPGADPIVKDESSNSGYPYNSRKIISLYYLGLMDNTPGRHYENFEFRRNVFIGQIAEIQSAHSNDAGSYYQNDAPSCQTGISTRARKMGAGHKHLFVPDPVEEMARFVQAQLTEFLIKRYPDPHARAHAAFALSVFCKENITGFLQGQKTINDHSGNEHSVDDLAREAYKIIRDFSSEITHGSVYNFIKKINSDFSSRTDFTIPPLTAGDIPYIQLQLADFSESDISASVCNALRIQPSDDRIAMEIDSSDPFDLKKKQAQLDQLEANQSMNPAMKRATHPRLSNARNKAFENSREFSLLFPVLRECLPKTLKDDEIAFLAKEAILYASIANSSGDDEKGKGKETHTCDVESLAHAYAEFKQTDRYRMRIQELEPANIDNFSRNLRENYDNPPAHIQRNREQRMEKMKI